MASLVYIFWVWNFFARKRAVVEKLLEFLEFLEFLEIFLEFITFSPYQKNLENFKRANEKIFYFL